MLFRGSWLIIGLPFVLIHVLCVDATTDIQPIAIDFGYEVVTAVYAHSTDNFTEIALLPFPRDEPYNRNLFRLRTEFLQTDPFHTMLRSKKPRTKYTAAVQSVVQRVSWYLPFLENPTIQNAWVVRRAVTGAQFVWAVAMDIIDPRLEPKLESLTLENVTAVFEETIHQVKAIALEKHGIEVGYAFFSVPEFFNKTLVNAVADAGWRAGVHTYNTASSRTVMATTAHTSDPKINADVRYFVIDQGWFHCDFRTTYQGADDRAGNGIKEHYLPIDMFSSFHIDQALTDQLVESSKALQLQVALGKRKTNLWGTVKSARLQIRNNLEVEFLGEKVDGGRHFDEYPLDLKGSGFDSIDGLLLTWDAVQAAEKRFVDSLARHIADYLILMRKSRDYKALEDDPTLERVDKVVILTDCMDGQLVKRAVQQALGNDIEIIGGSIHDIFLSAYGAARRALLLKNSQTSTKPKRKSEHSEL
ncbi:hypothetical protein P175DRAFT_0500962 [Aspergillus ochraceoroseus IBT 24754]|uniref:NodB homology domain-containing protein n=2 Tax=Aspergillus ochraceoroseus TaxID=138278 RepID=A0A2T5M0R0_9EURO|nr:uncharacterized protein P175DRAFT_0500962 [Aspergillus ochraceoroseus IBT 24754]KKK12939.1 hypothetical protein AOCH_004299 [Aspergillus ochraceoroseus]PTU22116.1 hypothetical protein P175DRAFT_0500962 [Aspergillus ochraceoroseus IBT 24754]